MFRTQLSGNKPFEICNYIILYLTGCLPYHIYPNMRQPCIQYIWVCGDILKFSGKHPQKCVQLCVQLYGDPHQFSHNGSGKKILVSYLGEYGNYYTSCYIPFLHHLSTRLAAPLQILLYLIPCLLWLLLLVWCVYWELLLQAFPWIHLVMCSMWLLAPPFEARSK